ncbi:MAG: hypothetical protein LH468_05195, partial [Nocardioides sp.]|nr:hypothetical protein [Nocardioides sp.]
MSLPDTPDNPEDADHTDAAGAPHHARADVELRVPADSAYVSVLRTTSAGLAARLDFTLDDIEDLRMSVGEACALVLPRADAGADLTCEFFMRPGELTVHVAVPSEAPVAVDEDSFGWQVLTTLASGVEARATPGRFSLAMIVRAAPLDVGRGRGRRPPPGPGPPPARAGAGRRRP